MECIMVNNAETSYTSQYENSRTIGYIYTQWLHETLLFLKKQHYKSGNTV